MRKFLFIVFVGFVSPSFAQVAFQNISFTEALTKAKAESKLVFIQIESPICTHCNEVGAKGLSDKEVSNAINQTFIPLYIDAKHKDRKQIEARYKNIPSTYGTLFIDQNGTLIHSYAGTSSSPKKYKDEIDIALVKAGENIRLNELEIAYQSNPHNLGLLEQILLKRKSLNLNYDAQLEEYASLLPTDSLTSIYTLRFIAGFAPIINSKADVVLRKDSSLFNQVLRSSFPSTRAEITHTMAYKSMAKAALAKDENYALQIALFAQRVASTKAAGEREFEKCMQLYYVGTNNLSRYMASAIPYFNRYYLRLNVDSVKNLDKRLEEQILARAKKDTLRNNNGYTVRATAIISPLAQNLSGELQRAADYVYRKTENPELLSIATSWVKKGLEFFETAEAFEVCAKLLYKQNQLQEAIDTEEKAITLKKKQGYPTETSDVMLIKMKNNEKL